MNLPLLDRVDALLREDALDVFGPDILGAEALSLLRELRDAHEYVVKELVVTLKRCHEYQKDLTRIRDIALIAHAGGLSRLDPLDTLVAVRRLTRAAWVEESRGSSEYLKQRVAAAVRRSVEEGRAK